MKKIEEKFLSLNHFNFSMILEKIFYKINIKIFSKSVRYLVLFSSDFWYFYYIENFYETSVWIITNLIVSSSFFVESIDAGLSVEKYRAYLWVREGIVQANFGGMFTHNIWLNNRYFFLSFCLVLRFFEWIPTCQTWYRHF